MNLEDFILKYAVSFSFRRTLKQKTRLLGVLNLEFEALGYIVKGIKDKRKGVESLNIHIGDVNKAKTLIVAPYDIPPRRFFTKGYHPLIEMDSIWTKLFSENIIFLSTLILAFGSYWLIKDINLNLSYVLLVLLTAINLLLTVRYPMGLISRFTFNKNNSSLAVILKVAETLKGQNDTAFVLLDHSSLNHHGELMLSVLLAKRKEAPLVIYLDCVGFGDQGMIFASKNNESLAQSLVSLADETLAFESITCEPKMIEMSALNSFKKACIISVGVYKNQTWFIPNVRTNKDTQLNENVLSAVSRLILNAIKKI